MKKPAEREKHIACYHRVSSKEQSEEGQSLESQERSTNLVAQARFEGASIVNYKDIATGTNTKRPEYRRLMSHIGANQIRVIIVVDIDRLCRNVQDFISLLDHIEKRSVGLISQGQGLDTTTPIGRLFAVQISAFAEFESRMISERVKRGHKAARRLNKKGPGLRPYGWKADENDCLVEDQFEQRAIDLAISRKNQGESWAQIAQLMNEIGNKPVKAQAWTPESIRSAIMSAIKRREWLAVRD